MATNVYPAASQKRRAPSSRAGAILASGILPRSELTWALNYTQLNTRAGAVLLFTGFYVLTGLIQQHLWQRLGRRAVVEYVIALVGGIAVAIVLS